MLLFDETGSWFSNLCRVTVIREASIQTVFQKIELLHFLTILIVLPTQSKENLALPVPASLLLMRLI